MRRLLLLPLLAGIALALVRPAPAGAVAMSFAPVEALLAAPDPGAAARAVRVDSLRLDVGRGVARLGPGVLVAGKPLGERTWLAAFLGPVSLEYAPGLAIERAELRRSTGAETWRGSGDAAFVVLCDSTLDALLEARPAAGPAGREAGAVFAAFARLVGGKTPDRWEGLVRGLLRDADDGYRLVAGFSAGRELAALELDPVAREDSRLELWDDDVDVKDLRLASSEATAEPRAGTVVADIRPTLVAEEVEADIAIEDDLDARLATRVGARMHVAGPTWAAFRLAADLAVDSVTIDGAGAEWGRRPKSVLVWVRLPAGLERGMAADLRFVTHGSILEREGEWISLKSRIGWLPTHDFGQRTSYRLRFASPEAYRLVAIGDLVASTKEGRRLRTEWTTQRPVRNPTFAIGPFDETRLDDPRLPPVTVLMSKEMQRRVRSFAGEDEVGGDLAKQTLADLANSFHFYRRLFGEPLDTTIIAAEFRFHHAEAFLGLTNLTYLTFSDLTGPRTPLLVRAHEMAHQWWALGADYATYRDRWLSEGFAEFSALWFLQVSGGSLRPYFEELESWRRELVPRRWRPGGHPEESSPIALGWRIRARRGEDAYQETLYHKGAWVLHMLRSLMLDPRTLDDQRFAAFLRETYRTHRGRSMSTADVRAIAEKHAGEDLGWFFAQWVEGTAIPTYRWAWRKEKQADGRWTVEVRVRASDTPEDFRMPVPVRLDLGQGRGMRFRVDVAGAGGTSTVEGLELEPRDLEFNEFAAVLCEARKEPW